MHYIRCSKCVQVFQTLDFRTLKINSDGITISKSSSVECWPILIEIAELPEISPEAVGVYCGPGKPKSLESYLREFVDELNDCITNGCLINGRKLQVRVKCIIADSPARAFLKNLMNFNGSHGCTKCEVKGKYSFILNTNIFTDINAKARTNESFRAKTDLGHHKGETSLTDLPIDMILDFPVGDELHLLHLGIMKKLILGWKCGAFVLQ